MTASADDLVKAMASFGGSFENLINGMSPDGGQVDYLACARYCDALGDDLRILAGATSDELAAALKTVQAQQTDGAPPPPPPPPAP